MPRGPDSLSSMSRSRWVSIPVALAFASVFAVAPATAARADDTVLTFDPPAEMTITYGETWYFQFSTLWVFASGAPVSAEVAGPFDGTLDGFASYPRFDGNAGGTIYLPADQPPTPAGSYQVYATLRADVNGTSWVATPAAPARLVVNPAPLSIVQKVVADPSNPVNAIISASMTGDYIDSVAWTSLADPASLFASTPRVPGGTWSISITDGEAVVFEREINQAAGGPSDLSLYWNDIPLGAQLTSTITFTPTGSAVGNFDVNQPAPFPFTSAGEGRPVPEADPVGTDQNLTPPASGPSFPLWAVLLAALLGLSLAAAIVGLIVSATRQKRVATVETTAPIDPVDGEPDPASMAPEEIDATEASTGHEEVAR